MRPLILIVVAAITLNSFPLPVFAKDPNYKLKQDVIEAKDILPVEGDKILVSLCGDIKTQTGYHKNANALDIPNIDTVRALAETGNSVAECNLGVAYQNGYGETQPDMAIAKEWFQRSSDQGNPDAQSRLGDMYEYGDGVKQNYTEAAKWYRKAAEQGGGWSQFILAEHYEHGSGVTQNDSEALKWYLRAAKQGSPLAALFLSEAYRSGTHGLAMDYVQAYMWASIRNRLSQPLWAGQTSDHVEEKFLERYEQGMTAEQIAEAKRLAAGWKPMHEPLFWHGSFEDLKAKKSETK